MNSGCYTFNLIDTYGDGGGVVTLTSGSTTIYNSNGVYGSGDSWNFRTDASLSTEDESISAIQKYPNLAKDKFNILHGLGVAYNISDTIERIVYNGVISNINQVVDISNLKQGAYFVKITKDKKC